MTTRTRLLAFATALAFAGLAATASAQAADPVFGTWELNLAKSTYKPGPPPKSLTRTYTAAGKGYKFSSTGVDANGKPTAVTFTVDYDGKYHPISGNPAVDSIMVKRIDANTSESVQKLGAKVVTNTSRRVSKDGKVLTSTSSGTNAAGKPYKNVEVFDKK